MSIQSLEELANTKEKLRLLKERYERRKTEPVENLDVKELTLRSLKQLINQLTEEVVRYEAHAKVKG